MADYIDLDYKMQKNINMETEFKYDEYAVQQSMVDILLTKQGEREFMPTYGSKLYWHLFEPMNMITQLAIKDEIVNALENWEPRISIKDVVVVPNKNENLWNVTIIYKIIRIDTEEMLNLQLNLLG